MLEFTLIRFSILLNFDYQFLGLAEGIWAIGISMMVLAGLVCLPMIAIAIVGLGVILSHNLLDEIRILLGTAMAGTFSGHSTKTFG